MGSSQRSILYLGSKCHPMDRRLLESCLPSTGGGTQDLRRLRAIGLQSDLPLCTHSHSKAYLPDARPAVGCLYIVFATSGSRGYGEKSLPLVQDHSLPQERINLLRTELCRLR